MITREEIDRSGLSTISEIIRVLPVNNNGTISEGFTNGFAAGASGVSMRGLGVGATLVLLNGRRLAPYGLADDGQRTFVDLNQIPFDAVERIEVLKDGASAIYGSDAIAGVINVILKTEYVGFNANASAGTSTRATATSTAPASPTASATCPRTSTTSSRPSTGTSRTAWASPTAAATSATAT